VSRVEWGINHTWLQIIDRDECQVDLNVDDVEHVRDMLTVFLHEKDEVIENERAIQEGDRPAD
jgi:hypothetical protein